MSHGLFYIIASLPSQGFISGRSAEGKTYRQYTDKHIPLYFWIWGKKCDSLQHTWQPTCVKHVANVKIKAHLNVNKTIWNFIKAFRFEQATSNKTGCNLYRSIDWSFLILIRYKFLILKLSILRVLTCKEILFH